MPYVRLRRRPTSARRRVPYRGSYCTASGALDKALVTTFFTPAPRDLRVLGQLFPGCFKNIVPKRGAHPETGLVLFIMMAQVMLLQPKPNSILHGEMVRRIVNRVVTDITKSETGRYRRRIAPKRKREQEIEQHRHRNADDRRQNQPAGIIGIIVMHAVNDEMQHFPGTRLRFVMEDVAMDNVLEERPHQNTEQKKSNDDQDRHIPLRKCAVEEVNDHRHVQNDGRGGMNVREELHELAVEHGNTFVLVRNVEAFRLLRH